MPGQSSLHIVEKFSLRRQHCKKKFNDQHRARVFQPGLLSYIETIKSGKPTESAKMKTAKQLKIAQWELDALVATRDFLAAEAKAVRNEKTNKIRVKGALFDMNISNENHSYTRVEKGQVKEYHCGTACCIGGWMSLLDQTKGNIPKNYIFGGDLLDVSSSYVSNIRTRDAVRDGLTRQTHARVLQDMFYPYAVEDLGYTWSDIKPQHAVVMIDNFLETGKVDWEKAMKLERVGPSVTTAEELNLLLAA